METLTEVERLGQRAQLRERERMMLQQHNRESIAALAIEEMRETSDTTADETEMDDDWINSFSDFSEKATSERLQMLWSKILAGEIRKPGSFSLTTLRIVSELDQNIATLFQNTVRGLFVDRMLVKPPKLIGQELLDWSFLEEVGLIEGASGSLGIDIKFDEDGKATVRNKNMLLILERKASKKSFRISLAGVTRAGREILSILPPESNDFALRRISVLAAEACDSIILANIVSELSDDQLEYNLIEKIK